MQEGKDDPGPRLGPPDRVEWKLQQLPAKIEAGKHQGGANENDPTYAVEARPACDHGITSFDMDDQSSALSVLYAGRGF